MGATSTAEEIVLKLQQNIDLQADAATGALGRLERQIVREQNSLGRLEQSLVGAKVKLDSLGQGSPDKGAVAAVNRQVSALAKLEEQHRLGKATANELAAGQLKLQKLSALAEASRSVDIAGYKKQQLAVAALTDKIGGQRDKLGMLRDKLREGRSASQQLGDSVKFLGSETGVTDSKLFKLGASLKALGPMGAVVAAGVLIAVGAVTLLLGVILKGISAAGQMRQELLTLQAASVSSAMGFSWLRNATHESRLAAEAMQGAIGRVNANSAAGVDKLTEFGGQILALRFKGKAAETVLNTMSMAFSGGGKNADAMAQDVLTLAKQVRYAGGDFDRFEKIVKAKVGVGAAQAAISLGVQLQRLRDNITWIFGGADIDPLLHALNSTLGIFNRGSSSATSMRDSITHLVEGAIGAMLRARIVVLQTYITFKQAGNSLSQYAIYFKIAGIAASGFLIVLLSIGLIVATAAIAIGLLGYAIYKIGYYLGYATMALLSWGKDLGKGLISLGTDIVMGIVNGIMSAGPKIWKALKDAVGGAVDKVRNLLDMHSPSRLMYRLGYGGIGGGLSGGIVQSAPMVERASTHLAQASVAGFSGSMAMPTMAPMPRFASRIESGASEGGKTGGSVFNFYDCIFGEHTDERTIRTLMHAVLDGEAMDAGVPG